MHELRAQAVRDLIARGSSEAGFFHALAESYAALGLGQTLDFAAVRA
jgi:hypothetical protein